MRTGYLISRFVEKLLLLPTLIWIYTPIVAGILVRMTYNIPLGFGSWWIFSIFKRNWLLQLFFIRSTAVKVIFLVLESIVFVIGLSLFLWGLFYLSKTKLKKQPIATGGPYKYVRHPQHLGMILISLSTSLYLPWAVHDNIRVGSIISWSLFTLFLVIISEFEEKKLLNRFGDYYLDYRQRTGMFFPRKSSAPIKKKKISEIKHWKRILVIMLIFFCFVCFIRFLCIPKFRLVGMWYDTLIGKYWYVNLIALGFVVMHFIVKLIRKRFISNEKDSLEIT